MSVGLIGVSKNVVDTLLVPIIADSNSGSGQFFDASLDTTTAGLYQIKHDFTVSLAQEPLDLLSMGTNPTPPLDIGPTTKLCQLLISNGHVPPSVNRIVIVPTGWAGTGLNPSGNNAWNVNSGGSAGRQALDGGGSLAVGKGLYGMINAAKAAFPNSKIWFFNNIMGANDGGMSQLAYTIAMQALYAEIRGIYADAIAAPILVSGIPPDKYNAQMGGVVNLGNIVASQQAIGSNISNAYYVDPTTDPILHSYLDNSFVHYSAASHRGGQYNIDVIGNGVTTFWQWNAGTAYTYAGLFVGQNCVVASDNFIYSCIADNTGNDPSGNAHPTLWAKQWDTSATVAVTDCLAYRQYQALLAAGF